jgi:hypothetical protein
MSHGAGKLFARHQTSSRFFLQSGVRGMRRLFLLVTLCAIATLAPTPGYADIVMNIWDDGTNLYMSAAGTYDMTNAASAATFSGLGVNAAVGPTFPLYGWETDLGGGSLGFAATFSGVLSGAVDVFPATSTTTTTPFFFSSFTNELYFASGASLTGSVNEFAIFNGVTLASLGMVAGQTVTASWGTGGINERGSISTIAAVPEPATTLIFGSMCLLGLFGNRRRRVC